MRSGSKRPMIGPRPCAYACVYLDPVFTSQSYEIIISTSTRRTNLSVFLVLMLMSTQPSSLAYRCACAYACAYALVKTRLKACQTTSSDGKRYRGLCRPNRLYFNYCLETTAKFKLNWSKEAGTISWVRKNLNRYGVDRRIGMRIVLAIFVLAW